MFVCFEYNSIISKKDLFKNTKMFTQNSFVCILYLTPLVNTTNALAFPARRGETANGVHIGGAAYKVWLVVSIRAGVDAPWPESGFRPSADVLQALSSLRMIDEIKPSFDLNCSDSEYDLVPGDFRRGYCELCFIFGYCS